MRKTFLVSFVLGLFASLWAGRIGQRGSEAACLVGGSCQAVLQSPLAKPFGLPLWELGLAYFVSLGSVGAFLPGVLTRLRGPSLLAAGLALFLQLDALFVLRGFCPACFTLFVALVLSAWSIHRMVPSTPRPGSLLRVLVLVIAVGATAWATRLTRPLEFSLDASQARLLERFAPEPLAAKGPRFVVFSDLGCPACYAAKPSLLKMKGTGRLIYAPVAKHPGSGYVLGEFIYAECLRRGEGWLFLERCPSPDSTDGFCHLALADLDTTASALAHHRPSLLNLDRLFDAIGTGQTPSVFRIDGDRLTRTTLAEMLRYRRV